MEQPKRMTPDELAKQEINAIDAELDPILREVELMEIVFGTDESKWPLGNAEWN